MVFITQSVGCLKRAHFDIVLRRGWAQLTCIEKAMDLCGMVNRERGGASRLPLVSSMGSRMKS
ncbi:hypothetical protein BDE02_02G002300 [Populus trichocarpa]|nr:hypothetical protein BDE02_02G002300 [Populus trichocarpa]